MKNSALLKFLILSLLVISTSWAIENLHEAQWDGVMDQEAADLADETSTKYENFADEISEQDADEEKAEGMGSPLVDKQLQAVNDKIQYLRTLMNDVKTHESGQSLPPVITSQIQPASAQEQPKIWPYSTKLRGVLQHILEMLKEKNTPQETHDACKESRRHLLWTTHQIPMKFWNRFYMRWHTLCGLVKPSLYTRCLWVHKQMKNKAFSDEKLKEIWNHWGGRCMRLRLSSQTHLRRHISHHINALRKLRSALRHVLAPKIRKCQRRCRRHGSKRHCMKKCDDHYLGKKAWLDRVKRHKLKKMKRSMRKNQKRFRKWRNRERKYRGKTRGYSHKIVRKCRKKCQRLKSHRIAFYKCVAACSKVKNQNRREKRSLQRITKRNSRYKKRDSSRRIRRKKVEKKLHKKKKALRKCKRRCKKKYTHRRSRHKKKYAKKAKKERKKYSGRRSRRKHRKHRKHRRRRRRKHRRHVRKDRSKLIKECLKSARRPQDCFRKAKRALSSRRKSRSHSRSRKRHRKTRRRRKRSRRSVRRQKKDARKKDRTRLRSCFLKCVHKNTKPKWKRRNYRRKDKNKYRNRRRRSRLRRWQLKVKRDKRKLRRRFRSAFLRRSGGRRSRRMKRKLRRRRRRQKRRRRRRGRRHHYRGAMRNYRRYGDSTLSVNRHHRRKYKKSGRARVCRWKKAHRHASRSVCLEQCKRLSEKRSVRCLTKCAEGYMKICVRHSSSDDVLRMSREGGEYNDWKDEPIHMVGKDVEMPAEYRDRSYRQNTDDLRGMFDY